MNMRRRQMIGGAALLAAPLAGARTASAQTTDLVVLCDKTLGPVLATLGAAYAARTAIRIVVFPTTPTLILPQLQRQVQNDIVVTQLGILQAATADAIVKPDPDRAIWRNRLVIATGSNRATTPNDTPFAVPDPPVAPGIDGRALLQAAGIRPGSVQGVIDTQAVAALLQAGSVASGLVTTTDVHANPGLSVIAMVSDALYPPLLYAAAVTRLARRGDPAAFLAFLATPQAAALLVAGGLELPA